MNSRTIHIALAEAPVVVPVPLHITPSIGVRSAHIKALTLGVKPVHALARPVRQETARHDHFVATENLAFHQSHPVRWGINE